MRSSEGSARRSIQTICAGPGAHVGGKKATSVGLTEDPRVQIGERRVDSPVSALDLIKAMAHILDRFAKGIGKHQQVGSQALAAGKASPRSKAFFREGFWRV